MLIDYTVQSLLNYMAHRDYFIKLIYYNTGKATLEDTKSKVVYILITVKLTLKDYMRV